MKNCLLTSMYPKAMPRTITLSFSEKGSSERTTMIMFLSATSPFSSLHIMLFARILVSNMVIPPLLFCIAWLNERTRRLQCLLYHIFTLKSILSLAFSFSWNDSVNLIFPLNFPTKSLYYLPWPLFYFMLFYCRKDNYGFRIYN